MTELSLSATVKTPDKHTHSPERTMYLSIPHLKHTTDTTTFSIKHTWPKQKRV